MMLDASSCKVYVIVATPMASADIILFPDGEITYITNGGNNTGNIIDVDSMPMGAIIPVGAGYT